MLGRRFVILVVVLMGLTALAASVAPRQPAPREDSRAESTPTASGSPTITTVEHEISTDGEHARVIVEEGDLVDLYVSGDEPDVVRLLGREVPVDPMAAAYFSILAEVPGEYPIELMAAEREIGTLVVR
jgi:hypothetical protein